MPAMTNIDEKAKQVLAPSGKLRVGIAVGSAVSAVWTARDAAGEPYGPTVDLSRLIADRIGLPLSLVEYGSSGQIIEASAFDQWDVAFTPVDAERKAIVVFGTNYSLGESTYMVPAGSTITDLAGVDRQGVRVGGVENTATIRSARRTLTNTTALGFSSLDEALDKFRSGEIDALALGKESIRSLLAEFPGSAMLDGCFHAAGTAIAVPKGREAALEILNPILEELKSDGSVRRIFDRHGMELATVAPSGSRS
jgi:polar amino acid transport system substrate-binding protein